MSKKFKGYLVEESKPKLKPRLHLLDDKIEKFIEDIEGRIDKVEDNPVFQRKMNQLLVDMSKEHGEFILALRSVVAAMDRGGQVVPMLKRHEFAARGISADDPAAQVPGAEEPGGDVDGERLHVVPSSHCEGRR